jgi:hypothetical protein
MNKIILISVGALALAGCTVREQQLATAGVAGAVVGAAIAQPQPRPYYVEEPQYVSVRRPPRTRCYYLWDHTPRGLVERKVCTIDRD